MRGVGGYVTCGEGLDGRDQMEGSEGRDVTLKVQLRGGLGLHWDVFREAMKSNSKNMSKSRDRREE